jgi:hypothetical protein
MKKPFTRTTTLALPLALFACSPSAHAQYGGGPNAYALERWEEDYSYLKDPSQKKSFLDAIKYVPILPDGYWYLSFGGQARYRYDYFNNYSFGPGVNDEDGFHLQRYYAHVDAHLGDHLRAFFQVTTASVDGRELGGRYGDADDFDLQQGFIDVKTADESKPFAFARIGRQELVYGAQRYVTPDDWRNVRRAFEGVKLSLSVPNDTVEAFATRPVRIERDEPNDADPSTFFGGVYNAFALPTVLEGANTKVENYLFVLNQTQNSTPPSYHVDSDCYTVGARFYTHPGKVAVDVEGNYQFGNVADQRLSAWSFAGEAGYTFDACPLTPRASVGFDAASGAPDPDGRFNQLFPPTYNYLGHLYLFGRPNLLDAHVGVDLHLTQSVSLYTAHHTFWRQNTNDGLYNLSGAVVRADNGSDASYVGNEIDVAVTWQIDQYWSAYMGYAHFFPGDFIADTGASKDVDFLYASVTFTF